MEFGPKVGGLSMLEVGGVSVWGHQMKPSRIFEVSRV